MCSVVFINGRWFADCGDTRHGPYVSADTATLVALSEARALRRETRAVKVSIQDESGSVCTEFNVGAEPKVARK
jgi:hypothetical protein